MLTRGFLRKHPKLVSWNRSVLSLLWTLAWFYHLLDVTLFCLHKAPVSLRMLFLCSLKKVYRIAWRGDSAEVRDTQESSVEISTSLLSILQHPYPTVPRTCDGKCPDPLST